MSEQPYSQQPFLGTLRGLSACAREFARLGDCLADDAEASFGTAFDRKQSVRRSPDRCIIQIGPCALTVAWLRNRRDTAEGELLIILWRGTVAPTIHQQFERARELTLSATAVSESVFEAEATCESDWVWRSREEPEQRYTSLSLSGLVVQRLRIIHDGIDSQVTT